MPNEGLPARRTPALAGGKVKNILKDYGIWPRRRLGQSFLVDDKVLEEIVEAADISKKDLVVEIGPGLGVLTERLLELAGKVIAIELDEKLYKILKERLKGFKNLKIIQGDILKLNLPELTTKNFKVVANLPYYITTPVLTTLLENRLNIGLIVVLLQKEVAQRIVAKPGGKNYGSLSIFCQYYTLASIVDEVPHDSFYPPPKVESAIVRMDVLKAPKVHPRDEKLFFQVVRSSFGKRRKMLKNALLSLGSSLGKDELERAFKDSKIDPRRRGETLSLEEFAKLSDSLSEIIAKERSH